MTIPEIFKSIDVIVARFNSDIEELKASLNAQRCRRAESRSGVIQPDLFAEPSSLGVRPKLGDKGYADAYNPVRQAVGRLQKTASGHPRAASPDRRKRGSVNVAAMTVNQHREYWRWCDARKKARAASVPVPTWETWKACVSAR